MRLPELSNCGCLPSKAGGFPIITKARQEKHEVSTTDSETIYSAYQPTWLIIAAGLALAWQLLVIVFTGSYAAEFEEALREHAGRASWPWVSALYFETYRYWWLATGANAFAVSLVWARRCSRVTVIIWMTITILLSLVAQALAIEGLLAPFVPIGRLAG